MQVSLLTFDLAKLLRTDWTTCTYEDLIYEQQIKANRLVKYQSDKSFRLHAKVQKANKYLRHLQGLNLNSKQRYLVVCALPQARVFQLMEGNFEKV